MWRRCDWEAVHSAGLLNGPHSCRSQEPLLRALTGAAAAAYAHGHASAEHVWLALHLTHALAQVDEQLAEHFVLEEPIDGDMLQEAIRR